VGASTVASTTTTRAPSAATATATATAAAAATAGAGSSSAPSFAAPYRAAAPPPLQWYGQRVSECLSAQAVAEHWATAAAAAEEAQAARAEAERYERFAAAAAAAAGSTGTGSAALPAQAQARAQAKAQAQAHLSLSAALRASHVRVAAEAAAGAARLLALEAAELLRARGVAPSPAAALARLERLAVLTAQRSYVQRTRRLPEYGSAFFVGSLARHLCPEALGAGSRGAPPTPDWAEALTASSAHATSPPPPMAVLVAINHRGVLTRPMPPRHVAGGTSGNGGNGGNGKGGAGHAEASSSSSSASGHVRTLSNGGRLAAGEPACFDAATGRCVPWQLHSVQLIEVWGVKKARPCFV
jgi:hypothetical protein